MVSVKGKENEISNLSTPVDLKNFYSICDPSKKFEILVHFLKKQFESDKMSKVLVFFATCGSVEYFSLLLKRLLRKESQNIFSIHRQKAKRDKIFNTFRKVNTGRFTLGRPYTIAARITLGTCKFFESLHLWFL